MSTPSAKRLKRDLKGLESDPLAGITAAPQDDSMMLWNAEIVGPNDTPWEGGRFKLTLQFTENYPDKPPTVRFVSKMFHPNILADGSIGLDVLQEWLLCNPNPDSAANWEAAQAYKENRGEYDRRVREIVNLSLTAE